MVFRQMVVATILFVLSIKAGDIEISSEIQSPVYTEQKDSQVETELPKNVLKLEESSNENLNTGQDVNATDSLSDLEINYINLNDSTVNKSSQNSSTTNVTYHISCLLNKTYAGIPVEIVNSSRLMSLLQVEPNITNRQVPANCVAVLFYTPTCPFSCLAAPHFNALPRIFPDIKMAAVDAMTHHSFNAQYGIVGVPTLMLFHNGRPAAKFNETSEYGLEMFAKFITKYTGVEPDGKLVVTSADFGGPISSVPVKERDYCLVLSWAFILICVVYSFYHSSWWRWLVDATLNTWREAEAQHHHAD